MQKIQKSISRNVLLNPGPATTSERVKSALVVSDICPREKEFGDLLGVVKESLKKVVFADSSYEVVLLGGSGTAAVESCLSSCTDSSKKVLILENGAYGERMEKICKALQIPYETLRFSWISALDSGKLDSFLKSKAGEFRTVAWVHHETTMGVLNPLKEIQEISKRYGLKTLVDAMSSFAGLKIDLREIEIDYLISSSNKCIQAMAGLGVIIVKKEELEEISSFSPRSFYLNLPMNAQAQKQSHQFAFTPPVQILYALHEGIKEFFEEGGIEAREKRIESLYQTMLTGMRELGFECCVSEKDHAKILTSFKEHHKQGFQFEEYHDALYQSGITIYPGKNPKENSFRISNIGDLNDDDMNRFLQSTKTYLDSLS